MAGFRWKLTILLFACVCTSAQVRANLKSTAADSDLNIVLGVVIFPPFTMPEEDDSCSGPYIDAVERLFAASGMTLNVVCAPAARLYRMLASDEVDLTINVKTTKELTDSVVFYPKPFSYLTLSLYQYADAETKTVAAIRAFDYAGHRQKLADDGYEFIDVPSATDAVQVFAKGRSDYLISYAGPYQSYMASSGTALTRDVLQTQINRFPTFFALGKDSPKRRVLSQWLDKVCRYTESNSTLLELSHTL